MRNQLRVLHVIPGSATNSRSTFTHVQISELERIGVAAVIEFAESRTNIVKIIAIIIRIARRARQSDVDIVHSHFGTVTALIGLAISWVTRRPLVVTYHGSDLNNTRSADGFWRDALQRLFSNIAALGADGIICVSARVQGGLWWKRGMVKIIPCGINFRVFRPMEKQLCRKLLGWGETENVVVFNNGNDSPIKRQDRAEAAISLLRETVPVRFEVLRNIRYEEVAQYLNGADCLLLTSESEGSPTVVKEAMACNLPIVSVDVGDVREQIKYCNLSELVGPEPKDIALAVGRVLAAQRRSNGRHVASAYCDAGNAAAEVKRLYEQVVTPVYGDKEGQGHYL